MLFSGNFTCKIRHFLPVQNQVLYTNVFTYFHRDIKDIDLYVGILAENPMPDGILGPVGSCIIADQFLRSKVGDRFWYETNDTTIGFSLGK